MREAFAHLVRVVRLFLPRLGSVVALQIPEDGLCRGFGNRCAERADHLVHHPLPRGTREWGLHRDIRRAVTDTAEALHKSIADSTACLSCASSSALVAGID